MPHIQTEGGSVIQGSVATNGGDFIGRDKVILNVSDEAEAQRLLQKRQQQDELRNDTFNRLPLEPKTELIPAGSFWMGSDSHDEIEQPRHTITLPDYRMGKYPVTNQEYALFLRQTSHAPPPRTGWFLADPPQGKEQHPVVEVSWEDACAYCVWLTEQTGRAYRLPTEAEWEKAASKTTSVPDAVDTTTPVGCNTVSPNTYGLWDILGNVDEWTLTLWGSDQEVNDFPYPYNPPHGPAARRNDRSAAGYPNRVYRVHRGGSYRSQSNELRVTARGRSQQTTQVPWLGFRVVLEIECDYYR